MPCPAFLITHPNAGSILVDTSLHSSIAAEPRENLGRIVSRYARPRIEPGRDLPSQLRELGADPRSIPLVVMTHLHVDHASGISEFPSSTFVISSAEWAAATTGSRLLLRGYRPQHYDFAFDYRLVDFDGPRVDSYASFARTFDLFGDGSVRLAFTPGHTLGHMCVLARLRDRDFVIAGDAVYTVRQLEGGPGAAAPARPPPLASLAPGAPAVRPLLPPRRDRGRSRSRAVAEPGREVRVNRRPLGATGADGT